MFPVHLMMNFSDTCLISYFSNHNQCQHLIDTEKGHLMSHNYPYDYDPNVFCSWIIEAPEDQSVVLNLLDFQVSEQIVVL